MVTFEFDISERYLADAARRANRPSQSSQRWHTLALAALVAVLIILMAHQQDVSPLPGLLVLLAVIACVYVGRMLLMRLINAWLVRRFAGTQPEMNLRHRVTLTSEGVQLHSELEETHQSWSAYSRAHQYKDGIVLFQGEQSATWLPFDALTAGDATAATSLVASHLTDVERIS